MRTQQGHGQGQGALTLMPRWALAAVYAGGLGWNGALGATVRTHVLGRRATCRACGQAMGKGTPVLRVCFDLHGTGSPDPIRGWIDCHLHQTPCCARAGGQD